MGRKEAVQKIAFAILVLAATLLPHGRTVPAQLRSATVAFAVVPAWTLPNARATVVAGNDG